VRGANGDHLRQIAIEGGGALWVAEDTAGLSQCFVLGDCQWKLSDSGAESFGPLQSFVDLRGGCGGGGAWHSEVWNEQCDLAGVDADRFAQLRALQAASVFQSSAECGPTPAQSTAWNGVVDWNGAPALVLQTLVSGELCITVALSLSQDRRGAMFSSSCAANGDETAAIFALPAVAAIPFPAWMGVLVESGSLAAELDLANVATQPSPQFVVSGQLDQGYVNNWLASAVSMSWSSTALDGQGDPLPASNATEPVGRLAKFLAAALLRLSVAPYPDRWKQTWTARDWLARNAMLTDAPAGLFLRGEQAIRGLSP
jgi:hypothetical protein